MWDSETSGVIPGHHEVVQISARAINYYDFSDHHAGKFSVLIKPRYPERASPGALKVIGPIWDKAMAEGISYEVAWTKFYQWIESVNHTGKAFTKPLQCAFNVGFDSAFAEEAFKELNLATFDKEWGWQYPWSFRFDLMMLFYSLFESDPEITDMKLNTAIAKLGLQRAKADIHDADEDVALSVELLRRTMKFLRSAKKKMRIE